MKLFDMWTPGQSIGLGTMLYAAATATGYYAYNIFQLAALNFEHGDTGFGLYGSLFGAFASGAAIWLAYVPTKEVIASAKDMIEGVKSNKKIARMMVERKQDYLTQRLEAVKEKNAVLEQDIDTSLELLDEYVDAMKPRRDMEEITNDLDNILGVTRVR